ncbi:MAG: hypothetical protein AB9Q18_08700 [Candidatus Reddybacter sp.]
MPNDIDDNGKSADGPISPEKFEPIQAADIPLSRPVTQTATYVENQPAGSHTSAPNNSSDTQSTEPNGPNRRRVYGSIATALACVLLLFIAIIYQRDSTDAEHSIREEKPTSAVTKPPLIEESPFQKTQLATARRTAQDILARVLEKQQSLEVMNIQQWAAEEYQQVLSAANEGDRLYREREFKAAIAHYESAEALLDKLEAGREPHIAVLLEQGLAAINLGQGEIAQQAFEQILLIAPDHPQALQGKQRCASLPEVFKTTEHGKALQAEGSYAAALAQYGQALNLDALFEPALQGKNEAQRLLDDEQFQAVINQGYQQLHSGELNAARKYFKQALAIKPPSDTAQSALAQVDNEIAQRAIARLLNSAQADESKEQWQAALDTYNKILSRDSAVTAATVGKIRSSARQQLDAKLVKFIDQPLRLASPAVYREAQLSLGDAKQIAQAGQRLKQQITSLSHSLANAQKPQTVVLRSDNLTRVSIFKLGKFGSFTEKTLQLKPGKYIAEGIRPGYRDVRVEFTVLGAGTAPVIVQCRETI